MTSRDFYADLGVRRVVNAATTLTALGGTVLPEEVVASMVSASKSCVSMDELHSAASARLAKITRNEDAYVTSGCAAGIALAVLAAVTKGRPELIARLPGDETLARNVVIHRAHRIPYDRAVELGCGRLVEVGNVIQTFEWELNAAIDENTAAVLWVAGSHLPQTALSLNKTVSIAHERGVPVIVDAAAQLPPLENLWSFTVGDGADVAIFSGGKALEGPQASGLMVGTSEQLDAVRANASPLQRLARAMKVGKEEVAGLVAALERYMTLDHAAEAKRWDATVTMWLKELGNIDGVQICRSEMNEAGRAVPRLEISFNLGGPSAQTCADWLWDGDPRVAVLIGSEDCFYVTPDTLVRDDASVVLDRLRSALHYLTTKK